MNKYVRYPPSAVFLRSSSSSRALSLSVFGRCIICKLAPPMPGTSFFCSRVEQIWSCVLPSLDETHPHRTRIPHPDLPILSCAWVSRLCVCRTTRRQTRRAWLGQKRRAQRKAVTTYTGRTLSCVKLLRLAHHACRNKFANVDNSINITQPVNSRSYINVSLEILGVLHVLSHNPNMAFLERVSLYSSPYASNSRSLHSAVGFSLLDLRYFPGILLSDIHSLSKN